MFLQFHPFKNETLAQKLNEIIFNVRENGIFIKWLHLVMNYTSLLTNSKYKEEIASYSSLSFHYCKNTLQSILFSGFGIAFIFLILEMLSKPLNEIKSNVETRVELRSEISVRRKCFKHSSLELIYSYKPKFASD